jgi:hypothetical protein
MIVFCACSDVFGVQQMAYAVDKSQMIMLRNNMVSKCGMPEFTVSVQDILFFPVFISAPAPAT